MKLTLVSFSINRRKFSAFVMLPADNPTLTMGIIEKIAGEKFPQGATLSFG